MAPKTETTRLRIGFLEAEPGQRPDAAAAQPRDRSARTTGTTTTASGAGRRRRSAASRPTVSVPACVGQHGDRRQPPAPSQCQRRTGQPTAVTSHARRSSDQRQHDGVGQSARPAAARWRSVTTTRSTAPSDGEAAGVLQPRSRAAAGRSAQRSGSRSRTRAGEEHELLQLLDACGVSETAGVDVPWPLVDACVIAVARRGPPTPSPAAPSRLRRPRPAGSAGPGGALLSSTMRRNRSSSVVVGWPMNSSLPPCLASTASRSRLQRVVELHAAGPQLDAVARPRAGS